MTDLQITDSSMYPRHKEKEILWMCKLPQCTDKIAYNETVWANLRNGESIIRKVIGLPGDKIDFSDRGRVKTPTGPSSGKTRRRLSRGATSISPARAIRYTLRS